MKKFLIAIACITGLSACDVLQKMPQTDGPEGVTQDEAAQGIKQALSQGLVKATVQLNRQDGFFADAFYPVAKEEKNIRENPVAERLIY